MELPLTSLVPTVVELISFWETSWPHIWWYPYWYLGLPYRFLIGPVVPVIVLLVRKLTGLPIETIYIGLISFAWIMGGVGIGVLARELGAGKRIQRLGTTLFLLLPFHFLLLSYGNGLHHLSTALLPWVFWSWIRALKSWRFLAVSRVVVLTTLVLLVNVSSFLGAVIGLISLILIYRYMRKFAETLVEGALLLFTVLSLVTIWYTPRFWWILLGNPSFGGKPLSNVITFVFQFTQALIPLILGVWVVQKRYRLKSKLIQFAIFFGSSFGFLTLIRFLSDIDFWMDWTSYALELQLTLSLLIPVLINRYSKKQIYIYITIFILTIVDGFVFWSFYLEPSSQVKAYKQQVTRSVSAVRSSERIFISGSPVFWLGSAYTEFARGQNFRVSPVGLLQVRGGKDEVATHPTWVMGAFNIREGTKEETLRAWLRILGVSYVLVPQGFEPYYDFKNTQRFQKFLQASDTDSDSLYEFTQGTIGRVAGEELLDVKPPRDGEDVSTLAAYTQNFGEPVTVMFEKPSQLRVRVPQTAFDLISLSITYDRNWHLIEGEGRLATDSFGNLVIVPIGQSTDYVLSYQESATDFLVALMFATLGVVMLWQRQRVFSYLERQFPTFATDDEEERY